MLTEQSEQFTERKKRAAKIVRALKKTYPQATTALSHRTPFQLLVATILSAQCTDKRVNEVTKVLFQRYKAPKDFAELPLAQLEEMIHSTGFYRQKAKSIKGTAKMLIEQFSSKVPRTIEELQKLPGVARKTANVVLGTAFGIASGVVVDTHVKRVTRRLKLSTEKDPVKIERDLMQLLPEKEWINFGHRLIWLGRHTCQARKPECGECSLLQYCPSGRSLRAENNGE